MIAKRDDRQKNAKDKGAHTTAGNAFTRPRLSKDRALKVPQ